MFQILLGSFIVSTVAGWWLFGENEDLRYQLTVQQVSLETQKSTIEILRQRTKVQSEALIDMNIKNSEVEKELRNYLDIFARHSLSKLAAAKPGLIEKRANDETKRVFDSIENDSNRLSASELFVDESTN